MTVISLFHRLPDSAWPENVAEIAEKLGYTMELPLELPK